MQDLIERRKIEEAAKQAEQEEKKKIIEKRI